MGILSRIASYAADLVGLRTCAVCGCELVSDEYGLCLRCQATLPRCNEAHLAARFADIFSNAIAPQGITAAWFHYDPQTDPSRAIRTAKYADRPRLARELGRSFGMELTRRYGRLPADVLLPVPMHWWKRMSRGYNQSLEIARGISSATGIAVGDNLTALRPHSTQTHKSHLARRENIRGIIGVDHPAELDGLRLAIVDDIITTGATIAECATAISISGTRPASIGFITLGATVEHRLRKS